MITGIIKEENDAMESIYLKSLQTQKLQSLTLKNIQEAEPDQQQLDFE